MKTKVLIIPDLHFPFGNPSALLNIYKAIKTEKPTHVVQVGDIVDFYSFSKFTKSTDLISPKEELSKGISEAKAFWAKIKKLAPRAKCYQLIGNHEDRIYKRVAEKLPEISSVFPNITKLLGLKGVKVLESSRDHLEIDNVIYCHGWYMKLGDHMRFFRKSVVHGHTHRAGIAYEQVNGETLFELDVGHAADDTSLPLSYTSSKTSKWVMGLGIVENGQPRLILI